MTAKQIFEKMLTAITSDYGTLVHLKLESEIDDVTMCETYEVIVPMTAAPDIIKELQSVSLWMDVKYEDCHPSEIIFYSQPDHIEKLVTYRLNDDLYNPFGIKLTFIEDEWIIKLIDVIISFFEAVIQKTIYDIVKSL